MGQIKSLVPDTTGGAWVLGSFENVNGYALTDLVHYAANGLPDPSFQVPALTAATRTRLRGIKALPGGRLLLLGDGDLLVGNRTAFNMLVLQPNGQPDPSFNVLAYFSGGPNDLLRVAVAAQPDGKLLVGGAFSNFGGSGVGGLIRLLPNGQMDPTFSPPGNQINRVRALAVQPDGRILVGGDGLYVNGVAMPSGIIRLQANGSLDASFTAPPDLQVWEMALQPDGRVLVGGDATNLAAVGYQGSIVRLLPSGLPDLSFSPISSPGRELVPFPSQLPDRLNNHFALQADGSLVVAFPPPDNSRTQPSLVRRYLPNGQPAGNWNTTTGPDGEVKALVALANGNVLLGGTFQTYSAQSGCLAAAQGTTGQLAGNWRPRLGIPSFITALAQQSDGRLLIAGNFSMVNDWLTGSVARLWPNGDVDTTFRAPASGIGTASTNQIRALAVDAAGKVLIGGEFTTFGGQPRRAIARLTATGEVDPGFQVTLQTGFTPSPIVRAIVIQPDSKVILGGSFLAPGATAGAILPNLVRVLSTGATDAGFVPAVPNSANVNALLLRPGGEILVGGNIYSGQLELMRQLRTNGTLDPTFQIVLADPVLAGAGLCIVPETGGGLLLGGSFFRSNTQFAANVTRLFANGTTNPSFVSALPNFISSDRGQVNTLVQEPSGHVVVGGQLGGARTPPYMQRLLPSGQIDASYFGTTTPGPDGEVRALLGLSNGRILAGGSFQNVAGQRLLGLACLLPTTPLAVRTGATAQLELWPNPVQGEALHLRFPTAQGPVTVQLLDALGRPVLVRSAGPGTLVLPTTNLPAGLYIVRASTATETVTRRVMVR
jgi:uncharacterized delta-60 repeat protein